MGQHIGVFGGSFNPIHHGHLILAQDVLESYELDLLLFVPCGLPPHKDAYDLAPGEHRLGMLELVTEADPRFEVSASELDRQGLTYTFDTLNELAEKFPHDDLSFIVGSDTLPEFHTWYRIEELLSTYRIISLVRPGFGQAELASRDFFLEPGHKEELLNTMLQGHRVDISSSDIRMRLAEGMSIRYLVPEEVEMYIYEHGLYKC